MNKCHFCTGKLKIEKINIARYWGENLIALENVPAIICKKCGERFFDAKVSAEIDKRVEQALQKKNIATNINVPVLQF